MIAVDAVPDADTVKTALPPLRMLVGDTESDTARLDGAGVGVGVTVGVGAGVGVGVDVPEELIALYVYLFESHELLTFESSVT